MGAATNTGITNDTDSETSSKTSKTDGKTSTELNETSVESHLLLETVGDEDRNDETVDTNDTSHNNGDNVCGMVSFQRAQHKGRCELKGLRTLDDEIRAEDTHGGDTNTRFGGTVGGAKAGEDNGASAAHDTEEGLYFS